MSRDTPFVPAAVATRALRRALLALQPRLCTCIATTGRRPESLRFVFVASPGRGRTEVRAASAEEDAIASCVGTFVATFPPFDFRGDLLECASIDSTRCTSPPASFVVPLRLRLRLRLRL